MSLLITSAALYIISCYSGKLNITVTVFSMIFIGISLIFIGPVEDRNKKLTKEEMKEYHKKIKIIICAEFLAAVAMLVQKLDKYAFTILVAWGLMLIMAVIGVIKNKIITWR